MRWRNPWPRVFLRMNGARVKDAVDRAVVHAINYWYCAGWTPLRIRAAARHACARLRRERDEARARHVRYLDAIGETLRGWRSLRPSGEPMWSDAAEIRLLRAAAREITESSHAEVMRVAELLEEIEAWKSASGLECGGDPDGVTPSAAQRYWEQIERDRDLARRELRARDYVDRWCEKRIRWISIAVAVPSAGRPHLRAMDEDAGEVAAAAKWTDLATALGWEGP